MEGDVETIAELLEGDDAGVLALLGENAVGRGWRDAREVRQGVDGDVVFNAELLDPLRDCFLGIHDHVPPSSKILRLRYQFLRHIVWDIS